MWKEAFWLGVRKVNMNGRFAYYRCEIDLEEEAFLEVVITANSR